MVEEKVEHLRKALESGDAGDMVWACQDLASEAEDEPKTQEAFVEAGALELVISAMKKFPENGKVQKEASYALSQLCSSSTEHRTKAASLGALELLLLAVRKSAGDEDVQVWVTGALASCCLNSDENKSQAASLGAIELLIADLQNHSKSACLQINASLALGLLCLSSDPALKHQEEALRLGAFDLIADTLPSEPRGDDFRYFALGALCQGAEEAAAGRRQRALKVGVVEHLEKAMEEVMEEVPQLQEEIQKVLDILKTPAPGWTKTDRSKVPDQTTKGLSDASRWTLKLEKLRKGRGECWWNGWRGLWWRGGEKKWHWPLALLLSAGLWYFFERESWS